MAFARDHGRDYRPFMADDRVIDVAIHGAAGRMGRRLTALASQEPGLRLAAAVERQGHEAIGQEASAGVTIRGDFDGRADVIVDLSTPVATRALIGRCVESRTAMVIGTTGLTAEDDATIREAARAIPICYASNFSLVVNVLHVLAARAAELLGPGYDIEILEAHHRFKKDAPSGTALALAKTICEATGRSFDADVVYCRHGDDVARKPNEITIQALRIGDHVGEHTAYFAAPGERLELRHVSTSRDSYARGALRAARWLAEQPPGRYGMKDVLGLG